MKSRFVVIAAVAAALVPMAKPATAAEINTVRSGWTAVHFYTETLHDLGLQFSDVDATAEPRAQQDVLMEDPQLFFAINEGSSLRFKTYGGKLIGGELLDGSISHDGGVAITSRANGIRREMRDFQVSLGQAAELVALDLANGTAGTKPAFYIAYPRHNFANQELLLGPMDLKITSEFAASMGRPELANRTIGAIEIHAQSVQTGSTAEIAAPYTPNFTNGALDVALGILDDMTQVAREGSYPTGVMGGACATTSCNLGTVDVPWHAAMEENHPSIAMALYRESNGKFEQVGVSDMKHGFFALSSSQCTPCQHPSDGTFLGVGCSDTYAVSNNSDRQWLAPRPEIAPFKGIWTCLGSHFAGGQPDCIRRHGGSGHSAAQHRLAVADADLGNAGATYYYEGYYVVANDANKHNNIGSRRCTMTLSGNTWNFNTPNSGNSLVEGPAIERWTADLRTNQTAPAGGQVILSVKTTDAGGGYWDYEYALFNFDSDRGVRSFSVPVGDDVTNIGFHDPDLTSTNDWAVTVADGMITWSCEDHTTNPAANYLIFGKLYNFRFRTNAAPVDDNADLIPFLPGTGGAQYTVATRTPQGTNVAVDETGGAARVRLEQNRPNPLSPQTTIRFSVPTSTSITLDVYDTSGRHVRNLASGPVAAGQHDITWDGTAANGQRVSSGQYYYRLQSGDFTAVRSMLVLK